MLSYTLKNSAHKLILLMGYLLLSLTLISLTPSITLFKHNGNAPVFASQVSSTLSGLTFASQSSNTISSSGYAKVQQNCLLFKSDDTLNSTYQNVYFEIPESYFVNILSKVNDTTYKVKYGEIIGFVDASKITTVSLTPKEPTLEDIFFNINTDAGTQIRTSPDASDSLNILTTIPSGTEGIKYIAKINATIPSGGASNVWYYAEYTPTNNPTRVYTGYIYSERTANLTNIPTNLETDVIIDDNLSASASLNDEFVTISPTLKIVLIALICLPIVIVFILLLVKNKHNKKVKLKTQTDEAFMQNLAPNIDNYKPLFKNNFTGTSAESSNTPSKDSPKKTIKAFKNKEFYKVDNFNKTLNTISTSAKNYKSKSLNLDALDEEDDDLL